MERLEAKIVALFIILVVIFVCTALPIVVEGAFIRRGESGRKAISILNCFGGGVFFGAYLIIMTPEVRILLNEALLEPNDIAYPLPELFIGLGFFLLMFVEKAVLSANKVKDDTDIVSPEMMPKPTDNTLKINEAFIGEKDIEMIAYNNGKTDNTPDKDNIKYEVNEVANPPHQGHSNTKDQNAGPMEAVLLMIGLSMDSVFGGLALGLQTNNRGVLNMSFAILSHEFIAAFTLGLQLISYNSPKKVFILSIVYGLTSPIGIAIGTIIYETGGGSTAIDILSGVCQAFSGGVFIYCAFLHILVAEITHDTPIAGLIAVLLGFGLMCCLAAIPEGSDDENGSMNGTSSTSLPTLSYIIPTYSE